MRKSYFAAVAALMSFPAIAQDYQATTSTNVIVRAGPGSHFDQTGTIPASTPVAVDVCFDKGSFCLVNWTGGSGFVSGDLLTIGDTSQTVHDAEATKWANWEKPTVNKTESTDDRNVIVWGDSLSNDTFGNELSNLLGRVVTMQGVGGDPGSKISARRLATNSYDDRITIVWDRHGRGDTPEVYLSGLKPLFDAQTHDRYIVISDIRSMEPDVDANKDAAETDAINAALKLAHADHFLDVTSFLDTPDTRTDGLHLTPKSYDKVAAAVADFIAAKGW